MGICTWENPNNKDLLQTTLDYFYKTKSIFIFNLENKNKYT